MGIKDFGKLAKLQITATESKKSIKVMFNPESYSQTFSNLYRDYNTIDTGFEKKEYAKTLPQEFKLKIIIDGTGVTNYNSAFFGGLVDTAKTVNQQVKNFKDLAWQPNNGKAPRLEIIWGDLNLKCVLKEVTINYTLFDREGNPLRAELDATFICDPEEAQQADATNTTKKASDQTKKSTANGIVISAS